MRLNNQVRIQNRLAQNLIFVRTQKNLYTKVKVSDVIHVKHEDDVTYLNTKTDKYEVQYPLKSVLKVLPSSTFIRCHRNYIINLNHIENYLLSTQELLVNGEYIPVGKTYRNSVLNRLDIIRS